jgi:transcriptional regulator with XRE-family HTH domain
MSGYVVAVMSELTFGAWLRNARSNHQPRISQERLAELTGMDRAHLSKIENDRVDLPRFETRLRIHRVLGTSDRDLIDAGVKLREDFGFAVSLGEDPDDLPSRDVTADRPDDRDNAPLTVAELEELKDAMFHGFDELEPADLREVIAVMRRRRKR